MTNEKKTNRALLGARFLLTVHGLVTIGYGLAVLADSGAMARYMGLAIISGDGRAELLVMYVGLSGVMGLFMLLGAFNHRWLRPALLFLTLSMSGIALARLLGLIFLDTGAYTLNALLYDIPIAAGAWAVFLKLPRQTLG